MKNANKKGGTVKIQQFSDLDAWKVSHELLLDIYRVTKSFPRDERYGMTNQIRRAALSVTSNIAEGFSRRTYKDKAHFYTNALGSLTEVQNQLIASRDLNFISNEQFAALYGKSITSHKLLNGLIKSTNKK